jgi:hypothetical protein
MKQKIYAAVVAGAAIAEPLHFVTLHNPKGFEIVINPAEVTALRQSGSSEFKHFSPSVHCWIGFTGGKYVTVVETCATVRKMMEEATK